MSAEVYFGPGTSVPVLPDMTPDLTSNFHLPKLGNALLPAFLVAQILAGSTSPASSQPTFPSPLSASIRPNRVAALDRFEGAPVEAKSLDSFLPELAQSVRRIHDRSGLTWDELAHLFGVTRRTLYNWSTGAQVSASHARTIAAISRELHSIESGDSKLNRSRLLAPDEDGSTIYSKIASRHRSERSTAYPAYRPDQLLDARHDSPDPTGPLTDFQQLS